MELVGETLSAALNEIATEEPEWLKSVAPLGWYENYSKRIENTRLPRNNKERMRYAKTVGEDGFMLLTLIGTPKAPAILNKLANVVTPRLDAAL